MTPSPAPDFYQAILHQLTQAFCLIEVLFDAQGAVTGYRFLEINPAFERLPPLGNPVGHTIRELEPEPDEQWLALYGEVARTGRPQHVERQTPLGSNRWYDVYALPAGPAGSHQVAVLFTDITTRYQTTTTLLAAQANQVFLTAFNDQLRAQLDDEQVLALATRLLGEHLAASQVQYGEVQNDYLSMRQGYGQDLPPRAGYYRILDWGERLRTGQVQVVPDTTADLQATEAEREALQPAHTRAYITVPLLQARRWTAVLTVHSRVPRPWSPTEVQLVEQAAERIGAALAYVRSESALRSSEARYRVLFESMDQGFGVAQVLLATPTDVRWLEVNPPFCALTGLDQTQLLSGKSVRQLPIDLDEKWFTHYERVALTGEPAQFELYVKRRDVWLDVYAFRVDAPARHQIAVLFRDSTARRQAGQQQQVAAVLDGQDEERRRIAEALHNGLGQLLYATKLQLDHLPLPPAEPARREAGRLLGEAINQTRTLSHELVPALLTDFGLQAALQGICRELSTRSLHWHCHLTLDEGPALSPALQLVLFRLAQGLAHNVAKHAQATEATLEVSVLPNWVTLRLEDNGRGFDPPSVQEGLGLKTLRGRVALLHGHLRIDSAPGEGTQILVRLPLTG